VIFICFFLAILVWLVQQGPTQYREPTPYVGLLIVLPVVATWFFRRGKISAPIGGLTVGFLVGGMGLISPEIEASTEPFAQLASIWVGLYLGSSLSPSRIRDWKLLAIAFSSVVAAILVTTFSLLLAYPVSAAEALKMGMLAALAAPYFSRMGQASHSTALQISVLTTGIGLLIWGVYFVVETPEWYEYLNRYTLLYIVYCLVGLELTALGLRCIRTDPGRCVYFGILSFLILVFGLTYDISPVFISLIAGFALSIRCGNNRNSFNALGTLSELLVPFVLADFAVRLMAINAYEIITVPWQFLLVYTSAMVFGKVVGGLLACRLTGRLYHDWITILPQGILAAIFLPHSLPYFASTFPGASATGFVVLCGMTLSLLVVPAQSIVAKIEDGRLKILS